MEKKKIFNYTMDKNLDICFVKCNLPQENGAPFATIITNEPDKLLRIIPVYSEEKFDAFIKNFIITYRISAEKLFNCMVTTIKLEDTDTEYRIICKDQSVSFFVEFDPLKGIASTTRTYIEDFPQRQESI